MTHDAPLTPAHRALLAELEPLVAAARRALPAEPTPCFAHMRVRTGERERSYLLGWQTVTTDEVTVLHWQNAPLAEVYFSTPEGSDYELELEDRRTIAGTVLARSLLEFDRGALVRVAGRELELVRAAAAAPWRVVPPVRTRVVHPRDEAARARSFTPVEVPLDEVQLRAVRRPPGGAMLVLGEAGCGKTTVALHRLAHLIRARKAAGKPVPRSVVIVPTEGLRRLTEALLARLGAPEAEIALYDRWAGSLARRAFRGIPVRESQDATAGVIRLKRHRALASVLGAVARRVPARDEDPRRTGRTSREDLLHLYGDRALMDRVVAASNGAVGARAVDEVIAHTKVQFSDTTEEQFAHVTDASRLEAVDGRALDAGTPTQDARTLDVEDYAVLFEIDRLRARARGAPAPALPAQYDCVVVDEAQELAPLELALIGRAVAPRGTLLVAGDAGQQVDPTACFSDWRTSMHDLGAADHDTTVLETSYRCPPSVTALARYVLDPRDPRAPLAAVAGSPAVGYLRAGSEFHLVAQLIDALRALREQDPRASVALITRTPAAARRLAQLVGRGVELRLALGGDFRFGPGVNVSCVQEVKGLEFDYVVVPDATSAAYPDSGEARRALYVAATRPVHQLVLASAGTWTPLLGPLPPAAASAGVNHGAATGDDPRSVRGALDRTERPPVRSAQT